MELLVRKACSWSAIKVKVPSNYLMSSVVEQVAFLHKTAQWAARLLSPIRYEVNSSHLEINEL